LTKPYPFRVARRLAAGLIAGLLPLLCHAATDPVSLPGYNVDPNQITVSGISSGAYMAVQFAVAHSASVKGVGAVAGGPYACAQGSAVTAISTCMIGTPDAKALAEATVKAAAAGDIDPVEHLATQKAWLFSGYNDGVVKRTVSDALYEFYKNFTSPDHLFYKTGLTAAHSQVTLAYGQVCNKTGGDFMNNCRYDAAGALLTHLLGQLKPKATGKPKGKIVKFSQSEFHTGETWLIGMSHEGFAYVPARCAAQQPCRLHIALHGCKQYATLINDRYYAHAGYNEWADANDLIVLYPQTVATTVTPFNPNGCWDWWGYVNADYAKKSSAQISALRAMVERIGSNHVAAGSAAADLPAPSVRAVDATSGSIALAWTPPSTVPAVPGAGELNVYRAECATCPFAKVNAKPVGGGSFGDHDLSPHKAYAYKVRMLDATGAEGPDSKVVTQSTTAAPPACDPYRRDNASHWLEGRANMVFGFTYAKGSGQLMGPGSPLVETTLTQTKPGYFVIGPCQ
jgi:poly(3-hydroxybutyrate) depolymerase